jgi:hypothetical protein
MEQGFPWFETVFHSKISTFHAQNPYLDRLNPSAMESKLLELQLTQLPQVNFAQEEVLTSPEAIKERTAAIEKAVVLGNGYKSKVRIFFKTKMGEEMCVHTTIWSYGGRFIILKGEKTIPVHAITRIE